MREGGGKSKGSSFEREICGALSLWISNQVRDDLYWRSSMSGGRATVKFKAGKENLSQTGDISSIDPLGAWLTNEFLIECKTYKDLNISSSLISRKGFLYEFWEKLVIDSKKIARNPLLIAKQNRKPILALTDFTGETRLHLNPQNALAILPQWRARIYLFSTLLETPVP